MTIINMAGGKAQKPIVVEAVEDTPSTLPYTFSPREGVDYLSSVTVGKDPNLVPENVKKDVSIFGVEGTYDPEPEPQPSGDTFPSGMQLPTYSYNLSDVMVGDVSSVAQFEYATTGTSMEWNDISAVTMWCSTNDGEYGISDLTMIDTTNTMNYTATLTADLTIPMELTSNAGVFGNTAFVNGLGLEVGDVAYMTGPIYLGGPYSASTYFKGYVMGECRCTRLQSGATIEMMGEYTLPSGSRCGSAYQDNGICIYMMPIAVRTVRS